MRDKKRKLGGSSKDISAEIIGIRKEISVFLSMHFKSMISLFFL
jgi:hypothetical protein